MVTGKPVVRYAAPKASSLAILFCAYGENGLHNAVDSVIGMRLTGFWYPAAVLMKTY
jgi:hypothetical protein